MLKMITDNKGVIIAFAVGIVTAAFVHSGKAGVTTQGWYAKLVQLFVGSSTTA